MSADTCLGNYPAGTVLVSVSLELAVYIAGVFLVYRLSPLLAVLYVGFIAILLLRLLGRHCTDCYYYGKRCAFGKGRLSALLFKKGNPEKFCEKTLTPLQMIPDLLLFAIPFIAGIAVLVSGFEWTILFLMILIFILCFPGNAYVRGQLACRYCRQREIGCPAEKLFSKKSR